MIWCHDSQTLDERKIIEKYKTFDKPTIITDLNGYIIAVNNSWINMCKFSAEEAFGKTPKILQGELTNNDNAVNFSLNVRSGMTTRASIINYKKDGIIFVNVIMGWQMGDILVAETIIEYEILGKKKFFGKTNVEL